MSRYRPPTPQGSKYITPEGAARLRAELDELWLRERPKVTAAVAEAAAQGDRSENADYIYGKRRLHEIDRRVRFLRKRLDGMTIVQTPAHDAANVSLASGGAHDAAQQPAPQSDIRRFDARRVYFGAWVQVETEAGDTRWYRIVGPDEFDRESDFISMDSPLGRSLMGKRLDDEVTVALPGGVQQFVIVDIRYGARP